MINQIIKKFPEDVLDEIRDISEQYAEFVVNSHHIAEVNNVLVESFGPPLKPEGGSVSDQVNKTLEKFGGIRKEQTCYYLSSADGVYIAMLWPWQDGTRTTIKIIRQEN